MDYRLQPQRINLEPAPKVIGERLRHKPRRYGGPARNSPKRGSAPFLPILRGGGPGVNMSGVIPGGEGYDPAMDNRLLEMQQQQANANRAGRIKSGDTMKGEALGMQRAEIEAMIREQYQQGTPPWMIDINIRQKYPQYF